MPKPQVPRACREDSKIDYFIKICSVNRTMNFCTSMWHYSMMQDYIVTANWKLSG
jgi:hypothetical protein